MLLAQLTTRIHDVINQLEHAMFLPDAARYQLQTELNNLVEARDKARTALQTRSQSNVRSHGKRLVSKY